MSFLSLRTRRAPSRRSTIDCRHCGERITLADQIRKDGDSFVHLHCVSGSPAGASQNG